MLGWEARRVRERRARLIRLGLVRLLESHERHWSSPSDLTELTGAGLEFVAAQQGLSLARAVRFNGLAGGGPEHPTGIRRLLVRDLAHTLGADALFIGLYRRYGARPRGERRRDPRVAERRGVQSAAGAAGRVRHGPSSRASFTASSWSTTAAR